MTELIEVLKGKMRTDYYIEYYNKFESADLDAILTGQASKSNLARFKRKDSKLSLNKSSEMSSSKPALNETFYLKEHKALTDESRQII